MLIWIENNGNKNQTWFDLTIFIEFENIIYFDKSIVRISRPEKNLLSSILFCCMFIPFRVNKYFNEIINRLVNQTKQFN